MDSGIILCTDGGELHMPDDPDQGEADVNETQNKLNAALAAATRGRLTLDNVRLAETASRRHSFAESSTLASAARAFSIACSSPTPATIGW